MLEVTLEPYFGQAQEMSMSRQNVFSVGGISAACCLTLLFVVIVAFFGTGFGKLLGSKRSAHGFEGRAFHRSRFCSQP